MTKLCILHTNDTHSHLDDFAKRAYLVNKIRQENEKENIPTFLFDAGDALTGNLYFLMYEGLKEAKLMSLLKYDAMTLGNHEFDKGSPTLTGFIDQVDFPIITSNIDFTKDEELGGFANRKIFPNLTFQINEDYNLGVFALTTLSTLDNASPSEETIFSDPFETAKKAVTNMQKQGVELVILLSHLGYENDIKMAEQVPGIDLIIGAHTHHLLENPVVINETSIVQAGSFGTYLGRVDIDIVDAQPKDAKTAESPKLIKISGEVINVHDLKDDVNEDPMFKEIICTSQEEKRKYYLRIVAEAGMELIGDRASLQSGETNLGKLVTNAFLTKARQLGYDADISIINGMGIRKSLPVGPICFGDIYKVLPFGCNLRIYQLTGQEIIDTLENGLYPQTSGLKGTLDKTKEVGKQIQNLTLLDGTPIRPTEKYMVASNTFVGEGRDFYVGFTPVGLVADNLEADVELFSEYLESLPQPVVYHSENDLLVIH